MFSLQNKDRMLEIREARYKAECALADSIDVLNAIVSMPVKKIADKVYCYCSIKGKNALFGGFYTEGDKAVQLNDVMDKSEFMDLNMAVISQLSYLRSQYEGCSELMPSELFLDFDPISREVHGLVGMEYFPDPYDSAIRFNAWLKEHGGKPMPAGPRERTFGSALKYRLLKQGEEEAHNPTANAVELDMNAIHRSRRYVAGEIGDPALTDPQTGWDAIRAELNRAYPNTPEPMSFENPSDSAERCDWTDIYDGSGCWHFVSCGLTDMGPARADSVKSLGAEYSLRLKKNKDEDKDNQEIFNTMGLVRELLDKAFADGSIAAPYTYVDMGFDSGMDADAKSDKVAFIIVPDVKLKPAKGPNGIVNFNEAVAITKAELQALKNNDIDVETLYKKICSDITDYNRKSVI